MTAGRLATPWTFRLPLPPAGWLELDLEKSNAAALFDAVSADISVERTRFVDLIDRSAQDARRRGAIVAFLGWRPSTEPAPTATLNVTAISNTAGDVGELGTALRTAQDTDVSPRVVEAVELPVGRALRVRVYASAGRAPAGGETVIDVVQYWLPVPRTGQLLVASSSTTEISTGDEVAGLLDAMMDRLTIEVP